MELLIDIGNTRIKWALLDGGDLRAVDALEHGRQAVAINMMLDRVATVPTRVVAANVAGGQIATQIAIAVRERWGLSVQFAETPPQAGSVRNGYADFRQLGVDRWLAIIAAVDRYIGAVCIVDAGTAITIDVVAADGAHLGGYIIPGLDLMRRSLGEETGDLRRLAGDERQPSPDGPPIPGRSTGAAIDSGTMAAVCGAIDRCLSILRTGKDNPTLIVTGGDATRLLSHLDVAAQHQPQLVLEGLAIVASGLIARAES